MEREGEAPRAEEGEQGAGEINTVITAWKCFVTVKVPLQHNTKYTYVLYLCEEAIVLGVPLTDLPLEVCVDGAVGAKCCQMTSLAC